MSYLGNPHFAAKHSRQPGISAFAARSMTRGVENEIQHALAKHVRDELGRYAATTSKADNIGSGAFGNSAAYTLARLRRDHPDLAARVDAGHVRAGGEQQRSCSRRCGLCQLDDDEKFPLKLADDAVVLIFTVPDVVAVVPDAVSVKLKVTDPVPPATASSSASFSSIMISMANSSVVAF